MAGFRAHPEEQSYWTEATIPARNTAKYTTGAPTATAATMSPTTLMMTNISAATNTAANRVGEKGRKRSECFHYKTRRAP